MKALDIRWSGFVVGLVAVLAILGLAVLATGCASAYDNARHWPITGVSVEKAYRLADSSGFRRVDIGGGEGRWVAQGQLAAFGADAEAMMKTNGAALLDISIKQRELARSVGMTDNQIVQQFNPTGKTLAQWGDALLASAVAAGAIAVAVSNGGDDGGSGSTGPAAAAAPVVPSVGSGVASSGNSGTIIVAQPGSTIISAAGGMTTAAGEMGSASSTAPAKRAR